MDCAEALKLVDIYLDRELDSRSVPEFERHAAQCAELDELLWRFKGETFIPHNLYQDAPDAPVVIGLDQPPATVQGLLLLNGFSTEMQTLLTGVLVLGAIMLQTRGGAR